MSLIAENKGPVSEAITSVITEKLQPAHLEVINESFMHNVPKGSETHFKVLVVSKQFEGLTLIKVNSITTSLKYSCPCINWKNLLFLGNVCFHKLKFFIFQRHRLVNHVIKEKLGELFPHALSIDAKTPEQWQPSYVIEPSPNCKGGFGK